MTEMNSDLQETISYRKKDSFSAKKKFPCLVSDSVCSKLFLRVLLLTLIVYVLKKNKFASQKPGKVGSKKTQKKSVLIKEKVGGLAPLLSFSPTFYVRSFCVKVLPAAFFVLTF
jgi:hypothetical protein